MTQTLRDRCLILACGNPQRGDDGAGWHLAESASNASLPTDVRVLFQQQWTPDLAEDISQTDSVLFVDCALDAPPGSISIKEVAPSFARPSLLTHHQDAASLLALSFFYYQRLPRRCEILLIGAESVEHSDKLSLAVQSALPKAFQLLLSWVQPKVSE